MQILSKLCITKDKIEPEFLEIGHIFVGQISKLLYPLNVCRPCITKSELVLEENKITQQLDIST